MTPDWGKTPFPEESNIFLPSDWKDGLIVRTPNWLGDFVMCVPALIQLRKLLPVECALELIAPKAFRPIVEALRPLTGESFFLADSHAFPTRKEMKKIKSFHPGAGVLFNNSFRDAFWMRFCGIKPLFGAKARNRSFLLKKEIAFPKRLDRVLNTPHQAAKYLAVAGLLGVKEEWDGILPVLNLMREWEVYSDDIRKALEEENLLAIAPGAMYGDAKKWPPEYYRSVAWDWIRQRKGRVVLLSAGNEVISAREAIQDLPEDKVIDLAGKTDLSQLMQILKQAKFCIANDSGTMHLSALVGGAGLSVFGSTDPAATSPISKKWRILYDKEECSPCFCRVCPEGTKKCLTKVTPEMVISCMEGLI